MLYCVMFDSVLCACVCVGYSEHHLTRLVCENERLRLACKNETVLTIYSAVFGHLLHGSPSCPQEPGSRVDMGLKWERKRFVTVSKINSKHWFSLYKCKCAERNLTPKDK